MSGAIGMSSDPGWGLTFVLAFNLLLPWILSDGLSEVQGPLHGDLMAF